MSEAVGQVHYDDQARLVFANDSSRAHLSAKSDSSPKVEVHMIRAKADESDTPSENLDLKAADKQAELVAQICFDIVRGKPVTLPTGRMATYEDIVILLRSAAGEAEVFAKVFSRRGIPFDARRTGFF